jgi:putative transcription factor
MECEVCGRPIGRPVFVQIEGAEMKVCSACAKFGSKETWQKKTTPTKLKKSFTTRPAKTLECVEDYSERIRGAREDMKLSREKLGERINEKASVIARLESGKMIPDMRLAKKLEQALGLKLLKEAEEEIFQTRRRGAGGELTIGDVIKIKKKG